MPLRGVCLPIDNAGERPVKVGRRRPVDVSQVIMQVHERGYDSALMEDTEYNRKDHIGDNPGYLNRCSIPTYEY